MAQIELREPWRSFLGELDAQLQGPIELHCLGGFVVCELYGLSRSTADIDILPVGGRETLLELTALAGKRSKLHQKYGVYIEVVTVALVPEDYEERLIDYEAAGLDCLRLRALEKHDLALAKLTRNLDRDVEDLRSLASGPGLDVEQLRSRYLRELRPQLGRPEREDLTLALWTEIIREIERGRS